MCYKYNTFIINIYKIQCNQWCGENRKVVYTVAAIPYYVYCIPFRKKPLQPVYEKTRTLRVLFHSFMCDLYNKKAFKAYLKAKYSLMAFALHT